MPLLVGGESVVGFFLDGEEAQQPVLMSCFHRTPAVVNVPDGDPFQGFTGSPQGNLSPSPTRQQMQTTGKISEPPKTVAENVEFKSKPDNLKRAFREDTDFVLGRLVAPTIQVFLPQTAN